GEPLYDEFSLEANAAVWGQAGGSVLIGGASQVGPAGVGSAGGKTAVLGYAVELRGSDTAGGSHALIGAARQLGGSSSGDILVQALEGGVSVVAGSVLNSYAQIGHRAFGNLVTDLSGGI